MIVGINAGFDGDLVTDLPLIAKLGFRLVRRDVDPAHVEQWLAEFIPYPRIRVLCIVDSALNVPAAQVVKDAVIVARAIINAGLQDRASIEIGNEPTLKTGWPKDPKAFQACCNAAATAIWKESDHIDVVAGAIHNTGPDEQRWLATFIKGLAKSIVVGYHTYRSKDVPDSPLDGFQARAEENAALRTILTDRRRIASELCDWTTEPWSKKVAPAWLPAPYKWQKWAKAVTVTGQFTEAQQAEFFEAEIHYAEENGAEAVCYYQFGGGPGLKREDGSLRPVASVAAKFDDKPEPVPVPVPQSWPVSFWVRSEDGQELAGVKATFRLDFPEYEPVTVFSGVNGDVFYQAEHEWGVWVDLELAGYDPVSERRKIPSASEWTGSPPELPEWPTFVTLKRPTVSFRIVDPAGKGIEGALVTMWLDDPAVPQIVTMSGAEGRVLYRPQIPGVGITVLASKNGYVTRDERRLIPMVSSAGPLPEWAPTLVLKPVKKPLPPVPTREQVCKVRTRLQGLTYHTRDYGDMPAPFFWSSFADRETSVYPEHRKVGDTHLPVGLSGSYNAPSAIWPPEIRKGGDSTNDLPAFKALLREVICEGFFPDIPLSGDGDSVRASGTIRFGEFNDPVGSTYGFEWLMQNFERIAKAVRGDADSECPDGEDLTKYSFWRPGWDGVFYGWSEPASIPPGTPSRVVIGGVKLWQFGQLFRRVLPSGYLGVEHNTGHIPAGGSSMDWELGGCMEDYDTVLSEFGATLEHNEAVWQIAGRLLGPKYRRPADQPAGSDPNGAPWYLHAGTRRGPYFVVAYEYDTYMWARGWKAEWVDENRRYLESLGYEYVC